MLGLRSESAWVAVPLKIDRPSSLNTAVEPIQSVQSGLPDSKSGTFGRIERGGLLSTVRLPEYANVPAEH